jgi:hypothetical protein
MIFWSAAKTLDIRDLTSYRARRCISKNGAGSKANLRLSARKIQALNLSPATPPFVECGDPMKLLRPLPLAQIRLLSYLMSEYLKRAVRQALWGVALGATVAAVVLLASKTTIAAKLTGLVRTPIGRIDTVYKLQVPLVVVGIAALLLSGGWIWAIAQKLCRSWLGGTITGTVPTWTAVAALSILLWARLGFAGILILALAGFFPIVASGILAVRRAEATSDFRVDVPESTDFPSDSEPSSEEAFDLPIKEWSQDRLHRGEYVRSIADLILRKGAPVVGILGPFGEGKTSVMNLLGKTLAARPDLIVVPFTSWLPGDERTLSLSLIATIADEINAL